MAAASFDCAARTDALLRSGCFRAPKMKRTPLMSQNLKGHQDEFELHERKVRDEY